MFFRKGCHHEHGNLEFASSICENRKSLYAFSLETSKTTRNRDRSIRACRRKLASVTLYPAGEQLQADSGLRRREQTPCRRRHSVLKLAM